MNNNLFSRLEELVNNPTPRVAVCLCLDTSGSMHGAPINELNYGVRMFYDAIKADETALYAADISVVTFGAQVKCAADFAGLELQPDPPLLEADGLTPMGEAVNLALDLLEKRKGEYKERGVDYYQPWLVLMTDGVPNGSADALARAIDRTRDMVEHKRLTVIPVGIGREADMDVLARFSPKQEPQRLDCVQFPKFFEWLSKSVSMVSQSIPGEEANLDIGNISTWDSLD